MLSTSANSVTETSNNAAEGAQLPKLTAAECTRWPSDPSNASLSEYASQGAIVALAVDEECRRDIHAAGPGVRDVLINARCCGRTVRLHILIGCKAQFFGDGPQVILGQRAGTAHQRDMCAPECLVITGAFRQFRGAACKRIVFQRLVPEYIPQP